MLRLPFLRWAAILLTAMGLSVAPARLVAGEVSVFAAASLAEALTVVAKAFEAQSGHRVTLTFAGSSALARQIEYGAPADVFVSANTGWVAHLNDRGVLDLSLQQTLYGNDLALIVPVGSEGAASDWTEVDLLSLVAEGRLAMALVDAVPAGIYGRQTLEKSGVWQALAPQVAQVDNVRVALSLVALGEAAAGLVYATDARAEDRVRIGAMVPRALHDPIVYPAAVVAGQDRPEVRAFMKFWGSGPARTAFDTLGFRVLEDAE